MEHKDLDRFGPPERNTLHPAWWFVFPLVLLDVFEGSLPALIYLGGDRVTWEVLTEYFQSPTPMRSSSFLVLQLVLLLYE